jgi:colanic acid biosynthesis protein WcaH
MKRIPQDVFKLIVEHTPLVSIDLIVRNEGGHMLLGMRRNRPAQDCWFVPGGRIAKNEPMAQAFLRITRDELGTAFSAEACRFVGVFEHIYADNFSGDPTFGTHYVVLAHELRVTDTQLALPQAQHSGYRWASDADILADDVVHENTKAYARLNL